MLISDGLAVQLLFVLPSMLFEFFSFGCESLFFFGQLTSIGLFSFEKLNQAAESLVTDGFIAGQKGSRDILFILLKFLVFLRHFGLIDHFHVARDSFQFLGIVHSFVVQLREEIPGTRDVLRRERERFSDLFTSSLEKDLPFFE